MPKPTANKNAKPSLRPVQSWKPTDRAVMTLKETGRVLCIGQTKVFNLINQGHLRVIHIGRRTLVPVEAVEHLLRVGA